MRKTITTALLAFALLPVMGQKMQQTLPQDAAVKKGVLPNGMTYYIRHHDQTPNVAEFYIAQRVGSILEEPRQRGLAHFLEHMAFNGTKNFPGAEKGGLREWCESVGIKFGANLNAYTSIDETVYNISSAPVNKAGVV
nr:insulinase family protein [Prevotella sp.]